MKVRAWHLHTPPPLPTLAQAEHLINDDYSINESVSNKSTRCEPLGALPAVGHCWPAPRSGLPTPAWRQGTRASLCNQCPRNGTLHAHSILDHSGFICIVSDTCQKLLRETILCESLHLETWNVGTLLHEKDTEDPIQEFKAKSILFSWYCSAQVSKQPLSIHNPMNVLAIRTPGLLVSET